jgi:hypothetical protein
MKDDNLGRDEKKHVTKKKGGDVERRYRRYAAGKMHEWIKRNVKRVLVRKGHM